MLVDVPSFRCGTVPVKKSGKEKRNRSVFMADCLWAVCKSVCVHCSTFLLFFFSSSGLLITTSTVRWCPLTRSLFTAHEMAD